MKFVLRPHSCFFTVDNSQACVQQKVTNYEQKINLCVVAHSTKGGNLATWRKGVSVSFGVLKLRCQVSVLVWFHGC